MTQDRQSRSVASPLRNGKVPGLQDVQVTSNPDHTGLLMTTKPERPGEERPRDGLQKLIMEASMESYL